jgi:glycosyltransferase involved in cell wall biosynthesis
MRPLRILMISALEVWALSGKGGAPSFFETLKGYGRRGHRIDVIAPTIGANHHHGAPIQPPPEIEGVRFQTFHLPSLTDKHFPLPALVEKADQKLRFAMLFPFLASRRALQELEVDSYDLLYGYELHGVLAQRLVRRTARLPLIARFQGTVMHPYLDRPLSLIRKYEEVQALKTPADLYIMTDDGTQGDEVLRRLNHASASKVRFWRNGLELDAVGPPDEDEVSAARRELGLFEDEFVLVTASRLARWKRIDRAIDAVALLRRRGAPAKLLIVGDGEEREDLEQQASSLGVGESIVFVGAVPQSDVQRYLWAADVFLSVSELSNLGNPLLEAMQAGRCIVTIDEGDTRTLIVDDDTGVLLRTGEPAAIADALARLSTDPARRERLGRGARALAVQSFWSWEQRIDAEVDAVEDLIGARSPTPADV